jgi:hypothetical protein
MAANAYTPRNAKYTMIRFSQQWGTYANEYRFYHACSLRVASLPRVRLRFSKLEGADVSGYM